jgi:hypothetical protein
VSIHSINFEAAPAEFTSSLVQYQWSAQRTLLFHSHNIGSPRAARTAPSRACVVTRTCICDRICPPGRRRPFTLCVEQRYLRLSAASLREATVSDAGVAPNDAGTMSTAMSTASSGSSVRRVHRARLGLLGVVFAHAVDARPAPPDRHVPLALKHPGRRRARRPCYALSLCPATRPTSLAQARARPHGRRSSQAAHRSLCCTPDSGAATIGVPD